MEKLWTLLFCYDAATERNSNQPQESLSSVYQKDTVEMIICNVILVLLWILILPLLLGKGLCSLYNKTEISFVDCFSLGTLVQWCIFQLISVPMIVFNCSFVSLVWTTVIVYVFLLSVVFLSSTIRRRSVLVSVPNSWIDRIALLILMLVFTAGVFCQIAFQHIDDDDSRFVVNIVDIIRSNSLFLSNPSTGEAIPVWNGELIRDVASPWAAFQACIAYLSGIQATIFAHTVQPILLFLLMFAVQWKLSEVLVGKKVVDRCVFCILLWLLIWFGNYTGWSAEGFIVRRIWQGKAIVAGIGIPYIIFMLVKYYENEGKEWIYYLFISNMAMCLLSNMGILFGAVLVAVFGLVYGILKKKIKVSLLLWVTAVPNLFYGILSLVI